MGKEMEYKLAVPEHCITEEILQDSLLKTYLCGEWQERHMKTTYYDSSDCRFSKHMWTLRHRMEGAQSVVCVKTPTQDLHTRGEWQINAEALNDDAIEHLILAGAPKELLVFYGLGDVIPICGADFIRKSVMLAFTDGSKAEFAYDRGFLHGKTEKQYLEEIELELYEGKPEAMLEFVKYLCKTYGLSELKRSKFSRAHALK